MRRLLPAETRVDQIALDNVAHYGQYALTRSSSIGAAPQKKTAALSV
jgi:hypothetical protein